MGILDGKKFLITGVLTDDSLAYAAAEQVIAQGGEIILSGFGRGLSLTTRMAKKLGEGIEVLEVDITNEEHLTNMTAALDAKWGGIDGALHAIAFAPGDALGGNFLNTSWEDVQTAFQVSAYSFKPLATALLPLLEKNGGGSLVGLDFDATVAWPGYDWMGVAKAGLEATTRYLARDLGPKNIRVNLVAAGPVRTVAAKSIPGFNIFEDRWVEQAPLGWNNKDATPVGKAVAALLSDLFPATTGEMIHVDGGFHAMGA